MGRVLANATRGPSSQLLLSLLGDGQLFLGVPFLRDVYGLATTPAATIAAATSIALLARRRSRDSSPTASYGGARPYVALSLALLGVWASSSARSRRRALGGGCPLLRIGLFAARSC